MRTCMVAARQMPIQANVWMVAEFKRVRKYTCVLLSNDWKCNYAARFSTELAYKGLTIYWYHECITLCLKPYLRSWSSYVTFKVRSERLSTLHYTAMKWWIGQKNEINGRFSNIVRLMLVTSCVWYITYHYSHGLIIVFSRSRVSRVDAVGLVPFWTRNVVNFRVNYGPLSWVYSRSRI